MADPRLPRAAVVPFPGGQLSQDPTGLAAAGQERRSDPGSLGIPATRRPWALPR